MYVCVRPSPTSETIKLTRMLSTDCSFHSNGPFRHNTADLNTYFDVTVLIVLNKSLKRRYIVI